MPYPTTNWKPCAAVLPYLSPTNCVPLSVVFWGWQTFAEAPSLSPAEIAEIGQEISTCGERLHRLIQNFLLYAELEIADTQSSSGSDLTEKTP
jgi:hypothetical protein